MNRLRYGSILIVLLMIVVSVACAADQGSSAPKGPSGQEDAPGQPRQAAGAALQSVDLQVEPAPVEAPPALVEETVSQGPQVQRYIDIASPMFEEALAANRAVNAKLARPSEKSDVDKAKRWFDETIAWQEKLVGALEEVGGPPDGLPDGLKEAHEEYFAALSELLAIDRRFRDRLANAGPDFNMPELALDPEVGLAQQARAWNLELTACGTLKDVARGSIAGARLDCGFRSQTNR